MSATATATAPAPTGPGRRAAPAYFPAFDGLRAVAALLVLVVHTGGASGFTFRHPGLGAYWARGEIGVSVFFLISGFLLYRPFVAAALDGRPAPTARTFLLRRVLRIVPLYWVVLAVTYTIEGPSYVQGVRGAIAHALFLQVYSRHWILYGVGQSWTLCIEVTFYLSLPLWALVLRRLHARSDPTPAAALRRELAALVPLYGFGLLFRWWVVAHPTGPTQTGGSWIFAWTDHFALGMALAAVSAYVAQTGAVPRGLRWLSRPGADVACWVAAAATYWAVSTRVGLPLEPLYQAHPGSDLARQLLYGAFAFALLLPAVFGPTRRGPVRRLLTSRVMAFLGLVSYGIYLWHQQVIGELLKHVDGWKALDAPYPQTLGSVVGITVLLSAVSYLVVERPGIAVGHRWSRRRRESAAVHGSTAETAR